MEIVGRILERDGKCRKDSKKEKRRKEEVLKDA